MPLIATLTRGLRTFASDVAQGFFAITHNGMAVVGLSFFFFVVAMTVRPDLRAITETKLIGWLQERQYDATGMASDVDAVDRATATDPRDLPKQQANLAYWLSRKYRVSAEPLGAMVAEAWALGERSQLRPSLILAIMAVQSRFNPFASGSSGQVGLMQIELQAHTDALAQFGGPLAAFDPLTNVRVGVRHLQGLIQQTDTQEEALALYGLSSGYTDEGQFVDRVLAEQLLIEKSFEKAAPTVRVGR